jgi:hypothetical protein
MYSAFLQSFSRGLASIAAKRFAARVSRNHAANVDGIQCYNVEIAESVQQRNRSARPPVN